MSLRRSSRRFSAARLGRIARGLLRASTLCAIATVSPGGRAHVNTAYFAWGPSFEIVWISAPTSRHSRNLRANASAAVAVYDSRQRWGGKDRGVQLVGRARELSGRAARDAARLYRRRFPAYDPSELRAYRLYRLRPARMKLFDERAQGGGLFITARVLATGQLEQTAAEEYSGDDRSPDPSTRR